MNKNQAVKIKITSEAVLWPIMLPLAIILTAALQALVSIMTLGSIVTLILPPLCFLS